MEDDMNVQPLLPQEPPHQVARERHEVIGIFFLLAELWRLICWIWSILIAGTIAGILGNALFTYITTGMLNFKDPRTLTVLSWFNTHLALWIPIFTLTLALTVCSYLTQRWRYRVARASQQVHDQSLITIATGVQRSLDELNAKRAASFR